MNVRTALLGTLALGLIVGLAPVSSSFASGKDDATRSSSSGSSGSGKSSAAKEQKATQVRLIGIAGSDNNGGIKYRARYEERAKGKSATNRRFDVEVQGAQPGQTFKVTVAGASVATITANALGIAKIEFRPSPDDADEKPLPAGFPRLKAGDQVQIGDATVTLRQR